MAHEDLMQQLPKGVERVAAPGIFCIRNNGGSYSVVVLTEVLVTCSGEDGKSNAADLACRFNKAWDEFLSRRSG